MKREALDRDLVRFTRRQLREALGFGDTQLKVHLARLVDLELVTPHRLEAGGFCYELAWHQGDTGGRVLPGLLDPTTLDAGSGVTTADRSGSDEPRSAPGRPPVGGWSAPGRPALHEVKPLQGKGSRPITDADGPERTVPDPDGPEQAVFVVAEPVAAAGGSR